MLSLIRIQPMLLAHTIYVATVDRTVNSSPLRPLSISTLLNFHQNLPQ
jgi:hypothetical protein